MATIQKFYLHDALTTVGGTLPDATSLTGFGSTIIQTATGAATNRTMDDVPGALQITVGPLTEGHGVGQGHTWFRRYCSAPLAAQTLFADFWTFAGGEKDTGATDLGNPDFDIGLFLWRPSSGTLVTTVFQSGLGSIFQTTEKGTVGAIDLVAQGWPDVTIQAGDILVLEVLDDYSATGSPPGSVVSFYYDGATDPVENVSTSDAASYLLAPAPITLGQVALIRTATDSLKQLTESVVDIKGPGLAAFQE